MADIGRETYTQHLKKVVDARQNAEAMLKRALSAINYVAFSEIEHAEVKKHIERCKELIISGNIILKAITGSEHIGEQHNEDLEEACELFTKALVEVDSVFEKIENLK